MMDKDYFATLHERNIATERMTGLLSILPRVPAVKYDDSFCRVVRQSACVEIDRIMKQVNQGDYDDLARMASIVGCEFKPEELITLGRTLKIAVAYEMVACSGVMGYKLASMLWTGNPANNTESGHYREFRGFELQTGHVLSVTVEDIDATLKRELADREPIDGGEFIIAVHPSLAYSLWNEFITGYVADGREYRVICDPCIPVQFNGDSAESSLYVIPLSPEGEEHPVTYIEFFDYRGMPVLLPGSDSDLFWTDSGFYTWQVDREKWDIQLFIRNDSRLVLKERATRLKVTYPAPANTHWF